MHNGSLNLYKPFAGKPSIMIYFTYALTTVIAMMPLGIVIYMERINGDIL